MITVALIRENGNGEPLTPAELTFKTELCASLSEVRAIGSPEHILPMLHRSWTRSGTWVLFRSDHSLVLFAGAIKNLGHRALAQTLLEHHAQNVSGYCSHTRRSLAS